MNNSEQPALTDNEIIAKWMGGVKPKFNDGMTDDLWYFGDVHHKYLRYDSDWNWLMDVVEKIGRIELPNGKYSKFVDFQITTNDGIGWIHWTKSIPGDQNQPQSYTLEGTMIQRTYKAVVEFIKWYSSLEQSKDKGI